MANLLVGCTRMQATSNICISYVNIQQIALGSAFYKRQPYCRNMRTDQYWQMTVRGLSHLELHARPSSQRMLRTVGRRGQEHHRIQKLLPQCSRGRPIWPLPADLWRPCDALIFRKRQTSVLAAMCTRPCRPTWTKATETGLPLVSDRNKSSPQSGCHGNSRKGYFRSTNRLCKPMQGHRSGASKL